MISGMVNVFLNHDEYTDKKSFRKQVARIVLRAVFLKVLTGVRMKNYMYAPLLAFPHGKWYNQAKARFKRHLEEEAEGPPAKKVAKP